MEESKKIIIFHINEFGGHSKAAQNLQEAFFYRKPSIEVFNLNGLGYFYPRGEKVVDFIYSITIKHIPHLWGRAYDRKKVLKTLKPYRKLVNRFAFGKLDDFIKKNNPNCIVATQAFPCGLVADFKQRYGLKVPLVGIVTDYYPHRFWVHPCVDRYVVACKEAKEVLVSEGVDEKKIKVLGIPISVKFLTTFPKKQIITELGFIDGMNSVLIMGGGLGLGPIKVIAQQLDQFDSEFQIIVVCGKNKKLYESMMKVKKEFKKPIFVFGYTESIHKIMDFSDIIITKGGGITISEALAKGLGMIITNPIPGQEERNVKHLLKNDAIIKADGPNEIVKQVYNLFNDKKQMYSLRENAKSISLIDSSLRIVDLILGLIS